MSRDTTRAAAALHGELDITDSGRLEAVLDGMRRDGYVEVWLDLAALEFLDAAGLGVLARAHAAFDAARGRLVLTGVRPRHRRLFAVVGLDGVLALD